MRFCISWLKGRIGKYTLTSVSGHLIIYFGMHRGLNLLITKDLHGLVQDSPLDSSLKKNDKINFNFNRKQSQIKI